MCKPSIDSECAEAIVDLYDTYDKIPENLRAFMEALYEKEDLHEFYKQCRMLKKENRDVLIVFREKYPQVLNGNSLADILKAAREKDKIKKENSLP